MKMDGPGTETLARAPGLNFVYVYGGDCRIVQHLVSRRSRRLPCWPHGESKRENE